MAAIQATTRSAFFQQYDFQFDPRAALYTEFHRLAKHRKWKQGSNSIVFEKAWNQCFGSEVPVGSNLNERERRAEAQHSTDNDEFSSMLRSLQSLDLGGETTRRRGRAERVSGQFASYYGSDAGVTERWQALCQDCGISPVPSSINKCKRVCTLSPTSHPS